VSDAGTPGWYPDPFRRFELRYFNGQRWTGDVSTHGNRMIDPPAAPPASPAAPFAAAGSPPAFPFAERPALPGSSFAERPALPGSPFAERHALPGSDQQWTRPWAGGFAQAPKPKRGKAIAAFVLAVSAAAIGWFPFVFALAAIAVVLAVVFGVAGRRHAKAHGGAGKGFATAALVISPVALAICVGGFFLTRLVVREIDRYDHPGDYTLGASGAVTDGTVTTCSGTIRNDEAGTRSYELTISYGQDGVKLASDVVAVADVAPGVTASWTDTQRITQRTTQPNAITCAVTTVRGPAPFGIRPNA